MTQRVKFLIELPENLNGAMLEKELNNRGCRVEVQGVFLKIFSKLKYPQSFKFKNEVEE